MGDVYGHERPEVDTEFLSLAAFTLFFSSPTEPDWLDCSKPQGFNCLHPYPNPNWGYRCTPLYQLLCGYWGS